jgi:hypothetical protein
MHSLFNLFRYEASIEELLEVGKKKGIVVGIGLGLTCGFTYFLFGAAFLYGVDKMLRDKGLSAGEVLLVKRLEVTGKLYECILLHCRRFSRCCKVFSTWVMVSPNSKSSREQEEQHMLSSNSSTLWVTIELCLSIAQHFQHEFTGI